MSSAAALASAVSSVRTDADARAVLGVIAGDLADAYTLLPQISESQGLRAQALSYLNTVNAYAQEIYAKVPNDDADLSTSNSARLGLLASQTDEALTNIDEAVGVSHFDLASSIKNAVGEIGGGIADVAEGVGDVAGRAAAAPFQGLVAGLASFMYAARVFLFVAGGIGLVYLFRRPLGRAIGGAVK